MLSIRIAVLATTCTLLAACSNTESEAHDLSNEEQPLVNAQGQLSCTGKKVLICHIPPGNPANAHSICVGAPAVAAHQRNHGDPLGACEGETAAQACDPTMHAGGTASKPVRTKKNAQACTGKKVLICHIPPGNPANAHTICVGRPAEEPHVRNHGDTLGACPVEPPAAPTPDVCVPPGGACTDSSQCSSQICVLGLCRVPPGGACKADFQCGSNDCNKHICEAVPPGGACVAHAQCASEVCTNGTCATGLPPGSACTDNAVCASGVCTNGG